jgi:ketosteroid isomerase-like protein
MNELDHIAVVKAAYAAFQQGDIPALLEQLTPDIKWFAIGPPHIIPTAGTRYGRNQVAQYFSVLSASEEIKRFQVEEFIAEGNRVVAIGTSKIRLRDTATILETPWVHIFNFHNGKISEFRSFYDSAASVEARLNVQVMAATLS